MAATSIHSTLTRHFLRRFLENDLISPDADRSQLLAVVGAALFSTTLLVSLFMSFAYIGVPRSPSQLALSALNDRYFYISLSMVVSALLAVAQWDSLVVDVRDAAILEPLPVRPTAIRRAKLAAVAVLGGAAALVVNLMPTLVFPWLLVYHTRMSVAAMLALMATHAIVTIAAGAIAYVTIIALREVLAAVLRPRSLSAVSPLVQGSLIVALGSALLLIPPSSNRIAQRVLSDGHALSPPMWFLGVYEVVAGDIVRHAPRSPALGARARAAEPAAAQAYDRRKPQFDALARRATAASWLVILVAAAAYAWNARRFPSAAPVRSRRRARWNTGQRVVQLLLARGQTVRAGFSFTLAAVWRSNLHRLTLACAGAAGVAAAVVTLSGLDLEDVSGVRDVPTGVFAIQPMFYGALLIAFRHGIRVPAELRANWAFQLAWRDRTREFLSGVRRAALVGVVIPALVIVLPLFAYLFGLPLAFAHAVLGLAGAAAVLEVLLFSYEKVPFTCTYLPSENLKTFAIPYVVAFLIGASMFAGMERAALQHPMAWLQLAGLLVLITGALRMASLRRTKRPPVDFDEGPATTQRLGLHT
jgi:hypothetical protein